MAASGVRGREGYRRRDGSRERPIVRSPTLRFGEGGWGERSGSGGPRPLAPAPSRSGEGERTRRSTTPSQSRCRAKNFLARAAHRLHASRRDCMM